MLISIGGKQRYGWKRRQVGVIRCGTLASLALVCALAGWSAICQVPLEGTDIFPSLFTGMQCCFADKIMQSRLDTPWESIYLIRMRIKMTLSCGHNTCFLVVSIIGLPDLLQYVNIHHLCVYRILQTVRFLSGDFEPFLVNGRRKKGGHSLFQQGRCSGVHLPCPQKRIKGHYHINEQPTAETHPFNWAGSRDGKQWTADN